MPTVNPPVSVRITPYERDLLEAAATQSRTNLSDFMRRKALEAAELELLDQRIVTIAVTDWEKFESWTREPAKTVAALGELAKTRLAWQD